MKKFIFALVLNLLIGINSFSQPVSITAQISYNGVCANGTYMAYRAWNNYNILLNTLRKPLIFICLT